MTTTIRTTPAVLYADRLGQQWIVRDPEGCFWVLPQTDNPWDDRQPFVPNPETELEPLPGHYSSLFRLPFQRKSLS